MESRFEQFSTDTRPFRVKKISGCCETGFTPEGPAQIRGRRYVTSPRHVAVTRQVVQGRVTCAELL